MATITGLTADRMQQIIDKTIVSANIVGGHLILTLSDGSTVDTGNATGPQGPPGIQKVTAFPTVPAPTDGDMVVRTDMAGDPVYKYTTGNGWVLLAGGLAKVTAFPATPADGDGVVRTDLNGSPIFMYSTENGWEQLPRMGAQTVPFIKAREVTVQSIPTSTWTSILFDTEDADTDNIHSTVTNTTRLTINTPGVYTLSASIGFVPGAGLRSIRFVKNGDPTLPLSVMEGLDPPDANNSGVTISTQGRFASGDYIEVQVYQTSGGALNTLIGNQTTNQVAATWLGGSGQTVDERGVPAARLYNTPAQAIPSAVLTTVAFQAEQYDTDGSHDTVTNTSRFTAKTPGIYRISYFGQWVGNASGVNRAIRVLQNGVAVGPMASEVPQGTTSANLSLTCELLLAAGDYIEVGALQDSGGALNLTAEGYISLVGSGKTVTPFARVSKSANQSFATGVQAVISWDTETSDNNNIHDVVSNNSRLTAFTAGVYAITGWVTWGVNGVGQRNIWIRKNGSPTLATLSSPAVSTDADYTRQEVMTLVEMAVGDYVELLGYQTSGAAVNVNNGDASSGFAMVKVGASIAGQTGIEIVEGWHSVGAAGEPAFQNAATAVAANPPKFYKDPKGVVRITGIANSPGANTTIFQLPAGYRPLTDQYKIGCQPNNQAAVMTWVGSDGTVKTMGAVGNQIDLSVHTFRADQ